MDRTDGAVEKVRSAMIAHARFFEENYTEYVTLLHGFGGLSRKVSPEEVAIRDRHEMLLRKLLKNARDAGELDIADIPTVARAVLSMINWMVRWYKPAGPKRAGAFAADFFDLLYNGMRKR